MPRFASTEERRHGRRVQGTVQGLPEDCDKGRPSHTTCLSAIFFNCTSLNSPTLGLLYFFHILVCLLFISLKEKTSFHMIGKPLRRANISERLGRIVNTFPINYNFSVSHSFNNRRYWTGRDIKSSPFTYIALIIDLHPGKSSNHCISLARAVY